MDGSRGLHNPTKKTIYAFKQLVKDNYVFIASGRNKALLPENIKALNPNGYILCNGAYAEVNNKSIFTKTFNKEDINTLCKYVLDNNGFYILESIDNVYCDNFDNPAFKAFMNTWGMALKGFKEFKLDNGRDEEFSISMVGFLDEDNCKDINESIKDFATPARHLQFLSFDINIKNVDKGEAVKEIIKYLNIPFENTYAFGDGINDLEMLLSVKHPVIMANCDARLRTYNFEETKDVLDDGFYHYLVSNKLIKPM